MGMFDVDEDLIPLDKLNLPGPSFQSLNSHIGDNYIIYLCVFFLLSFYDHKQLLEV